MPYKINIRIFNRLVSPSELDAFEAELARYNLRMEINDHEGEAAYIKLEIVCTDADDEILVHELAALCFGDASAV